VLSENTTEITTKELFAGKDEKVIRNDSYKISSDIPKKTDFAFDMLLLNDWKTPLYISEGLLWLNE
jgi:hypothetical protein